MEVWTNAFCVAIDNVNHVVGHLITMRGNIVVVWLKDVLQCTRPLLWWRGKLEWLLLNVSPDSHNVHPHSVLRRPHCCVQVVFMNVVHLAQQTEFDVNLLSCDVADGDVLNNEGLWLTM